MSIKKKFICRDCKKEIIIDGTEQQWATYKQSHVSTQKIFPELKADHQEILITGRCGECFNKIFE